MLIYDLADPQELVGFTRGVQQERDANVFVLSRFLPNQPLDDIEWRVTQGQLQDEDAAVIRAWDTESPIGGRQGLNRIMGELAPMSKKYRIGEEDRLRKRQLERGGDASEIVAAIFDDAGKGARSLSARVEMLRGEALVTGELNIDENGVVQTVDFGRDTDLSVNATTPWSTHAGNDILTEELAWRTAYRDINGFDPGLALMSQADIDDMLLNEQYRGLAAYQGITPAFLNNEQLNLVRRAHGLPPIFTYDVKVRVSGTQTRVIPEGNIVYLPPAGERIGATFTGTTAEALELAGAAQIAQDQVAGMTSVVEKTFDPVATWTKTAAIALPVLINPDLTMVADVT